MSLIKIKKKDFYLVKCDFKLVFDQKVYLHIKSELHNNLTTHHSETFSLVWIEYFVKRGHRLPQIN